MPYYVSLNFSSIFESFGDFSNFSKKSHFSDHPKSRISTKTPLIFEILSQDISNFRHEFQLPAAASRNFQNIKSVQNWVGFKSRRVRKNYMRAKKKLLKNALISNTSIISPGGKGEAARPEGTVFGAAGTRMGTHAQKLIWRLFKFVEKKHFSDHPKSRILHRKSQENPSIFEIPAQQMSNFRHGFQLSGAVSRHFKNLYARKKNSNWS